ncbi:MAG: protein-(glutamine-N5) methyltransferase, release factor-specific [Rhodobacterales bacterium]|nr:MAG: protein-(glutamine-N5) methyltransferase, release factor-specific [Rhodobacterales bacterium]
MLRDAGIESAQKDARLFMAACLDIDPGRVTLHLRDPLDAVPEAVFLADIHDRKARKPVSHILGHRDFYGRRFTVTSDVLDPRPETETLIAAALETPFSEVLDLGTGSGAILVTLLAERPQATGIGSDLSKPALRVAHENAQAHGALDRCALIASDWYDAIGGRFDLIVSNPPYIALEEMPELAPELSFEPRMALTDEADGLTAYRAIAAGAGDHLSPGGRLMVEIGWQQGAAVAGLFKAAGLTDVSVRSDLDGRDRVVIGHAPG